jgi:hypothetical protein
LKLWTLESSKRAEAGPPLVPKQDILGLFLMVPEQFGATMNQVVNILYITQIYAYTIKYFGTANLCTSLS